jgi:hypothetical protein
MTARNKPVQLANDVPTEAYLAATGVSIVISLLLYLTGKKQAAQFVGLWAPTIINLGLFAKLLPGGRSAFARSASNPKTVPASSETKLPATPVRP